MGLSTIRQLSGAGIWHASATLLSPECGPDVPHSIGKVDVGGSVVGEPLLSALLKVVIPPSADILILTQQFSVGPR